MNFIPLVYFYGSLVSLMIVSLFYPYFLTYFLAVFFFMLIESVLIYQIVNYCLETKLRFESYKDPTSLVQAYFYHYQNTVNIMEDLNEIDMKTNTEFSLLEAIQRNMEKYTFEKETVGIQENRKRILQIREQLSLFGKKLLESNIPFSGEDKKLLHSVE